MVKSCAGLFAWIDLHLLRVPPNLGILGIVDDLPPDLSGVQCQEDSGVDEEVLVQLVRLL